MPEVVEVQLREAALCPRGLPMAAVEVAGPPGQAAQAEKMRPRELVRVPRLVGRGRLRPPAGRGSPSGARAPSSSAAPHATAVVARSSIRIVAGSLSRVEVAPPQCEQLPDAGALCMPAAIRMRLRSSQEMTASGELPGAAQSVIGIGCRPRRAGWHPEVVYRVRMVVSPSRRRLLSRMVPSVTRRRCMP